MKVLKTGWKGVPGKRLALPSLLAGCLLGCANFSVVDANGRFTSFPTELASKDLGTAEANVPAQLPSGAQSAAKPGSTLGRAPRVTTEVTKPESTLATGLRTKLTNDPPPVSKAAKPAMEPEEMSIIDLVEEEPESLSQTEPPFALPKPAPVSMDKESSTTPPFPTTSKEANQPVGTLTIPPPPMVVQKETPSAAKSSEPEMEIVELLEEKSETPVVSAEEFDAQLTAEKAPLPPLEMDESIAPLQQKQTPNPVELAIARSPGDEEVVELQEPDLTTLRSATEDKTVQTSPEVTLANEPPLPVTKAPNTLSRLPRELDGTMTESGLLELSGLRLCREILGFGQTNPLPPEHIQAGRTVLLYAEISNFHTEKQQALFTTRLLSRVSIEDTSGTVLHTLEFAEIEDRCETRRTDFFCHYTFQLPETLSPGSYVLRLKVKDVLGGEVAERTMDFAIATPQIAKGR